jgi:hypothetical protein
MGEGPVPMPSSSAWYDELQKEEKKKKMEHFHLVVRRVSANFVFTSL